LRQFVNSREWDELVRAQDDGKIYHLHEWGALLSEVHGHKLIYLTVNEGVFALALVRSRIFGDRLISLPFADYGGPCASNPATAQSLVREGDALAGQSHVDFLEIRSPAEAHHHILEEEGFQRRDDYFTYILPLDSKLDELWRGIGDKNRNMVRKAERNNLEIRMAADRDSVREFYRLYLKTMKKLGSPPQPYRFFGRMWDLLHPDRLIMPMAMHDGKCIAGGIFFVHNGVMHHAYSCALREYLSLAPNELLQWWVINWGNKQGYRELDFGRTREGAGNVLFKRRWGGKLVNTPYFYKFYRRELKERQEVKYKNLSKLWSKFMPESVAGMVGPGLIKQIG